MPKISERGNHFFESPIRRLVPFADAAKEKGVHIYHLNIGQPDIKTPKAAIDAVRNCDLDVLEYTHSAGNISYRKKLVEYYKGNGIVVTEDDIIITTGASEAILFGMMSCLDEGDEVIVPEPFYANYLGFSQAAGISVKAVTATIDNNFALPSIAAFEAQITDKTKAIMICNPSNPTGYVYSRAELEALKALVKKHDLFLFADEVYREFCYGEEAPYISVLSLDDLDDNVVILDSISKRYSACGARIGMIVSKNPAIIETVTKFAQARLSPPTMAQILAEATLDVSPEYLINTKQEYQARRDVLIAALNEIEGVICHTPNGAFYAFAKLPIDNADKFCKWLLEDFSHNNETIMLSPGSGFYTTPGLGEQEVRIAYVLQQKELKTAISILKEALQVYPGRTNS